MLKIFGNLHEQSGMKIYTGQTTQKFTGENFYLLHLLSGSAKISTATDELDLSKTQILLIQEGDDFEFQPLENSFACIYSLSALEIENLPHFATQKIDSNKAASKKLADQLNRLERNLQQTKGKVTFESLSLSYQILEELKQFATQKSSAQKDERIQEITRYIKSHYAQDLSLDRISEEFELSAPYFSRYFRKEMKTNYLDYVMNYRLLKAAQKIQASKDKISRIALEAGFENINNFNLRFKKKYQMTPLEYRKNYQAELIQEETDNAMTEKLAAFPTENEEVSPAIQISADFLPQPRHNRQPWSQIINISTADDLLQGSLQHHVHQLKAELDFKYIRFWNLFTKSMNLDPLATEEYNFEKVDSLLDFLLREQLFPFIELRYKVRRLHKSVKEMLIFENQDSNFQINSQAWFAMIGQFIKHVNERYGKKNVDQWKFEFSFEYHGDSNELEELIHHYKKTYQIIKNQSQAQIGGPSERPYISEDYDFRADLAIFAKKKVQFDFLSYILYPYENSTISDDKNAVRIASENFFINSCQLIRQAMQDSAYKDCEFYITEWSNTISNRNSLNDGLFKGSWLIKSLVQLFDSADAIAYWVGSDLFGEYADSREVLHGSTGLLTRNGLAKSAMHAFSFLNLLLEEIYFADQNLILSYDPDSKQYHGILYNYEAPNIRSDLVDEGNIGADEVRAFFTNQAKSYEINIPAPTNQKFVFKKFTVNQANGDLFSQWYNLDIHNRIIDNDLKYWNLLCSPKITFTEVQTNDTGNIKLKEVLNSNDFVYFELYTL